jgi:hypothetical protein
MLATLRRRFDVANEIERFSYSTNAPRTSLVGDSMTVPRSRPG